MPYAFRTFINLLNFCFNPTYNLSSHCERACPQLDQNLCPSHHLSLDAHLFFLQNVFTIDLFRAARRGARLTRIRTIRMPIDRAGVATFTKARPSVSRFVGVRRSWIRRRNGTARSGSARAAAGRPGDSEPAGARRPLSDSRGVAGYTSAHVRHRPRGRRARYPESAYASQRSRFPAILNHSLDVAPRSIRVNRISAVKRNFYCRASSLVTVLRGPPRSGDTDPPLYRPLPRPFPRSHSIKRDSPSATPRPPGCSRPDNRDTRRNRRNCVTVLQRYYRYSPIF